jgi:hypothetical protein
MKRQVGILSGGLLAVAALLGLLSLPQSVHAEDEADNPLSSIQLSPVSHRISLNADQTVDSSVKITNSGTNILSYRVYAAPYSVADLTYEADFDTQTDYTKLANWINFDQTEYLDVPAGESREVVFHIVTPSDIPGGGQYAVVFVETLPDSSAAASEAASIQTVGRVGSLIYADLGGETRRLGELVSFSQPVWAEADLKPTAQIRNDGNIDFTFTHNTVVKTLFGKEVFNGSISRSVLPGTIRTVTQEWTEAPALGLYLVSNQISFLGQTPVDETKLVYIGQNWIMITILVILGLIFILAVCIIIRTVRNIKKNKKGKTSKTKQHDPKPTGENDQAGS